MKALLISGVVLTALGGAACDPIADFQGAADSLVDPDETRLSTEPVRIVRGHFSRASVSGSAKDGGVLAALEHDEDETHLRLARFVLPTGKTALEDAELESCDAGASSDYLCGQWFEPGSTVLSFLDPDGDGAGTLRFIGPDCVERREPLDDVVFASWQYVTELRDGDYLIVGYVLVTRDQGLLYVDAKTLELKTFAEKTLGYVVNATSVFFEKDGEIVVLESGTWDVLERFGRGVIELAIERSGLGGDPDVVFRDDFGLRSWSSDGLELIAEDGCEATLGSLMFSYFDPCDERRLHVRGDSGSSPLGAELPGVREKMLDGTFSDRSFFVTVGDGESGSPGTLYRVSFEEVDAPESSEPPRAIVEELGENAVLDWPGYIVGWSEAGGTWARRDEEGRTLSDITDTFAVSGMTLVLSNYRDGLVDLKTIDGYSTLDEPQLLLPAVEWNVGDRPPGTWGDAVFWDIWDEEYENAYVVADVKNGSGEIRRFSWTEEGSLVLGKPLVKGALVGSAVGLESQAGVAYLKSGGRGELWVHLLEAGFEQPVDEHVSEYRSISWPSPGLLYVVESGEDAGIWFAKAR